MQHKNRPTLTIVQIEFDNNCYYILFNYSQHLATAIIIILI